MNQDEITATETQKLTEEPTYAKLGGEHQSLDMNASNEEYITFDFMVSLSSHLLTTNNNLQLAIKESVDCELNQIKNLLINEIDSVSTNKKECRVSGKVSTDDWELTMLQNKFQKIISDRVLSGNLQRICALDNRPTIRRFYCKTSKQLNANTDNKTHTNNSLAAAHKTPSFRTAKDENINRTTDPTIIIPKTKAKAKVNESNSIDQQYENTNNSSDSSPNLSAPLKSKNKSNKSNKSNTQVKKDHNCECFCVIL